MSLSTVVGAAVVSDLRRERTYLDGSHRSCCHRHQCFTMLERVADTVRRQLDSGDLNSTVCANGSWYIKQLVNRFGQMRFSLNTHSSIIQVCKTKVGLYLLSSVER